MKTKLVKILIPLILFSSFSYAQEIKGICLGLPKNENLEKFKNFIDQEFVSRQINLLILRVGYSYQFQSHPELAANNAWSKSQIQDLVQYGKSRGIKMIPLINMFGHQSNGTSLNPLLSHYPEFDETPSIQLPEVYQWPNEDELYCKSYCPLHPNVHDITFDLIDEILDAFQSDTFHAGMDEVFYIGHDDCIRCKGKDRSTLFAEEVNRIYSHLEKKNQNLMIWGDRLLDGKATGLGMWEASENDTHRSIDLINKNVIITDWHYDSEPKTFELLIDKGYKVMTCPWNKAEVAAAQWKNYAHYPDPKNNYLGLMQTIWTSTEEFMEVMKDPSLEKGRARGTVACFKTLSTLW